jgi:hypothetical protein
MFVRHMTDNNQNDLPSEAAPEGPAKPTRHMLFGRRFEGNVRRREDTNKSPIGRRVPKPTRRYLRRMMMRRTQLNGWFTFKSLRADGTILKQIKIGVLRQKMNPIDSQLAHERRVQNETGKLATNSHERARAIAEDKECRRNARKAEMQEQFMKRTAAGESLRPLGVPPTRQEVRANAKAKRKELKKLIRQQQLHERMFSAIGVPSTQSSGNTTE